MAGTKTGGARAAETNKAKFGPDFYREIGRKGGKVGRTGGFYANRELAREAGRKGGTISRRGSKKFLAEVDKTAAQATKRTLTFEAQKDVSPLGKLISNFRKVRV